VLTPFACTLPNAGMLLEEVEQLEAVTFVESFTRWSSWYEWVDLNVVTRVCRNRVPKVRLCCPMVVSLSLFAFQKGGRELQFI